MQEGSRKRDRPEELAAELVEAVGYTQAAALLRSCLGNVIGWFGSQVPGRVLPFDVQKIIFKLLLRDSSALGAMYSVCSAWRGALLRLTQEASDLILRDQKATGVLIVGLGGFIVPRVRNGRYGPSDPRRPIVTHRSAVVIVLSLQPQALRLLWISQGEENYDRPSVRFRRFQIAELPMPQFPKTSPDSRLCIEATPYQGEPYRATYPMRGVSSSSATELRAKISGAIVSTKPAGFCVECGAKRKRAGPCKRCGAPGLTVTEAYRDWREYR